MDLCDSMRSSNGIALCGMAAARADFGKTDGTLTSFAEAENLLGDNIGFSIDYAKAVGMAGATRQDDPLLNDA